MDYIISLAGGSNVASMLEGDYAQISSETLITANPEVIVLADAPFGVTPESVAQRAGWSAIAAVAKKGGATVMIDNTWATPLYFKPFEHGCDISIHAGTKYIVGHSDAMMGIISCKTRALFEVAKTACQSFGFHAAPDDCYLALRGLRTMGVRLRHHEKSGIHIANWLKTRPEVDKVLHPALPDCPGHDNWKKQFKGASGLFSFTLRDGYSRNALAAMLDGMDIFGMGASWGGYESLLIPAHPDQYRTAVPWPQGKQLLRVHIGLEDVEDLKTDLAEGFERLNRAHNA